MRPEELTKNERWRLADKVAEDFLPLVNERAGTIVPSKTFYARHMKRLIDIIISLFALVITAPINILLAVGTTIDVGRPILFRQERVGKNGKTFTLLKFRNMRNTYDERGELLPASERVTKFGAFVRKTSLDELLNFWSILKGDMSIIGPRPLLPEYTHRLSSRHQMRLSVRPGLECPPRCLSQHVWTWQEQFENDVWYVENVSFLVDVKMVINLVRFALSKKDAEARATAQRGIFMGYDPEGNAIRFEDIPDNYIRSALRLDEERQGV